MSASAFDCIWMAFKLLEALHLNSDNFGCSHFKGTAGIEDNYYLLLRLIFYLQRLFFFVVHEGYERKCMCV
jgi:hypothetical protein